MEISLNDINTYQLPSNCFQSHYKIVDFLGEGSFGKVFKAREISTGKIVAVKKMSINHSEKKYSNIIKEINLLKHLDHPNIVKYYDYFEEEDYIYLMMEYLEGGTLREYINNNKNISENESRIIIKQLLTALSYLHYACDICHRDVKPENIMFANKNDINELKLLDFGLSSDSFESKKYLENCGTLIYMAPEQINKIIYSKAVDVWSVGIILYMLLNKGKNPFYNKGETQEIIIKNITNNNIIYNNECPISHMGKHLINKLLKKNPSYRYTIRTALEHPWITMNKFDKIPMTIYDKAFVDEYADKLKTLLLTSIFFSYQKKHKLTVSKNNNKNNKLSFKDKIKKRTKSNSNLKESLSLNEKKKPKRKSSENILKIFNMDEYEQMVKKSNLLYKQKFKEDRETMFNPKLVIKNTNELLLSTLMKKIAEKQKTRQSSFLHETKTNINNQNKKFESLNILDNSHLKEKQLIINKRMPKIKNIYIDEQKNPEIDFEQHNLSRLKTPLKHKNNIKLLEKNKSEINKKKLIRRFSAIPNMSKNSFRKMNNEESKIKIHFNDNKIIERKMKNKTSPIKNYIDCSKKENENKSKNDKKIIKYQMEYKKKKNKTKSVKNTIAYFQLDRSTLIDIKDKKWKIFYNKNYKKFPFLINKEKLGQNLYDPNIFTNNDIKEHGFLNNEKNITSFTEQTHKIQFHQIQNKKLPKLFYN